MHTYIITLATLVISLNPVAICIALHKHNIARDTQQREKKPQTRVQRMTNESEENSRNERDDNIKIKPPTHPSIHAILHFLTIPPQEKRKPPPPMLHSLLPTYLLVLGKQKQTHTHTHAETKFQQTQTLRPAMREP